MRCPICEREVERNNPEFPFCSQRCRVQDLANWADGKYVVHTPVRDPEAFGKAENPSTNDEEDD